MRSILTQHKSLESLEKSAQYDKLLKEIFDSPPETININKNLGEDLAELFYMDKFPSSYTALLSRTWQRANMLATWNDKLKLPDRKECAKSVVQRLKDLKEELTYLCNAIATFMLFENTVELNIEILSYHIDETIKFLEDFIQHQFAPGEGYSTDYFKRHAINSLFYMGKKMGLSEKKSKSTQLNQFVQIITNRLSQDIAQDHRKFKDIDFIAKYEMNKNYTPIEFIYNPHCKFTNAMLSDIKNRFLTQ